MNLWLIVINHHNTYTIFKATPLHWCRLLALAKYIRCICIEWCPAQIMVWPYVSINWCLFISHVDAISRNITIFASSESLPVDNGVNITIASTFETFHSSCDILVCGHTSIHSHSVFHIASSLFQAFTEGKKCMSWANIRNSHYRNESPACLLPSDARVYSKICFVSIILWSGGHFPTPAECQRMVAVSTNVSHGSAAYNACATQQKFIYYMLACERAQFRH